MYRRYVIRRIANGVFIYVVIVFILSLLFNTTNETTARAQIEESLHVETTRLRNMNSEQMQKWIAERRVFKYHAYRLDRPFIERVVWRTIDTITFNYGLSTTIKSSQGDREVWKIVSEVMPRTVLLFTTAIIFEILFGVWLGLKKAQKAGRLLDKSTSIMTMVVYGMPSWWLGMIMIMFFAYILPIFPSGGMHRLPPPQGFAGFLDLLYHMALPLITLLVIGFWGVALLTRNIVLGILQEDYIMAARARGLPERRILFGHTMRTAAPPITTIALLSLLASIFGNIVFEGIYSWPGMGNLYWIAVEQNDIPVLLGLLSVTVGLYIVGLVALDLTYGFLDPRIKVGGTA
jgi:peptide/nickel transport system permease protein